MRKISLFFLLLILLFSASESHAKSITQIKYVYMYEQPGSNPWDPWNSTLPVLEPVDVKVADSPLTILPYATIQFDLQFNSPEEMEEFVGNMRVVDLTTGGEILAHIDEANTGGIMSFDFSGFAGTTGNQTLYYTPKDGLKPGHQYRIQVPTGWSAPSNLEFSVKILSSALPVYNITISNVEDWRNITTTEGMMGDRTPFVPCIFHDVTNIKQTVNPVYSKAEIRIRGYYSRTAPKKNFTIKFDDDQLFNGFKDSSGVHQGNRKKIVFVANMVGENNTFVNNKLSYDLLRDIEERIYGAALVADSYFGLLVINGRFWGLYNITEHIDVGEGGWNTMKDRREKVFKDLYFLNQEGGGILHKVAWEGKMYPEFGTVHPEFEWEQEFPYFGIVPQTEHKYRSPEEGYGLRTHWEETIPFPVYAERYRDSWNPIIEPDVNITDFEFEVKAKLAKSDSIPKMELNPDMDRYWQEMNFFPGFNPDLVYLIGDGTGSVQLNEDSATFSVDFSSPVYKNKPVNAYYYSTFDYDQFYRVVSQDPSRMFDWMHLDSILLNIFFVRFAQSWDNVAHNYYQFANYWKSAYPDSRNMNLEDYRGAEIPPQNQWGDIAKYYQVIWDCDLTFPLGYNGQGFFYDEESFPLAWKVALADESAAQRYVDILYEEIFPGGILTKDYYENKINGYIQEIGDAEILEEIRWQRQLDISYLKEYFQMAFPADREVWMTDLLTLQFDENGYPKYIPPSTIRLNLENVEDQHVEIGETIGIHIIDVDNPNDELWIRRVVSSPALPSLMNMELFGNDIPISPQPGEEGVYTVEVEAWNRNGLAGTVRFNLEVIDPFAPIPVDSCRILDVPDAHYVLTRNLSGAEVTDRCFKIIAPGITFDGQGHTISNTSLQGTFVYVNAWRSTVKNCTLVGPTTGTYSSSIGIASYWSDHSVIENNTIRGFGAGIWVHANKNIIQNNIVENSIKGINVRLDGNIVKNNISRNNRRGQGWGFSSWAGTNTLFEGNVSTGNLYGIILAYASGSTIRGGQYTANSYYDLYIYNQSKNITLDKPIYNRKYVSSDSSIVTNP
jgi:hypothetical protein